MVTREMLNKLDHKMQVRFAVFCARQVIDLVDAKYKEVCLKAIEAAEGFVEGKVSKEECRIAAYTATAAYAAARALARKDIEQEQIRYYNELLNFDKIVEEMMGVYHGN